MVAIEFHLEVLSTEFEILSNLNFFHDIYVVISSWAISLLGNTDILGNTISYFTHQKQY